MSDRDATKNSIDIANSHTVSDNQNKVYDHDSQVDYLIALDHKYMSEYYGYISANDSTLSMTDSQIRGIAWSGGKIPVLTPAQADYANQLAEKYLSVKKLCLDIIIQDNKISYPSYINKEKFSQQECR